MTPARKLLALGLTALFVAATAGCYQRVVSADGLGSDYADVKPSYRSDTALDRAWDRVFEPPRSATRSERWTDSSRDTGTKRP